MCRPTGWVGEETNATNAVIRTEIEGMTDSSRYADQITGTNDY
jgi:hypothetical protein